MVVKIGHRGAAGYALENSFSSFKKAIDLKPDFIELDVHVCKTGELIVMHDDTLDRTTNGSGKISEKTYEQIKSLKMKNGEKIPLLQEVLDLVNKKTKMNIELKGYGTALPVYQLISSYIRTKGWKDDNFLVTSFKRSELRDFHALTNKIRLGVLLRSRMPFLYKTFARSIKSDLIILPQESTRKLFVDLAHSRGFEVYVYRADTKEQIEKMKKLKVEGIISDQPDLV